ncbi:helix-hairpin-helix domain-containing protein [uncultured Ruminococcus sp.]|uniref:ComEA family DNA-binding protein n=1 Tax=uncultured Ruminococcus sp. TaxID=165186 RepID=UPI0026766833|nr:helix-hairpin-helix domain-containing protein [uncultured Ruminococcus sp.]
MKQECLKWLMWGGTTVLLAGAVGLLLWQGTRHVSERELSARPQRLAAATVETTGTEAAVSAAETTLHTGTRRTKTASAKRAGQASQETRTAPESTTPAAETVTFPLELNAASAAELEQLPHIGAVLAERITAYRDQIGGFSNREQLLEVEGIGEATLYEIYDLLYLENETFPEPEPEPEPAESPAPAAEPQPAETAPPATEPPAAAAPAVTFPLDLNQATTAELEQIPEMQPELAEKIVAFRLQIQAFSSVYELLYVDGMTEAYFVQLREYVQITEERAQ